MNVIIFTPKLNLRGEDMKKTILFLVITALFISCKSDKPTNYDYLNSDLPTNERVEILLKQMTLEEKIGQMTQVERNHIEFYNNITLYYIGSILSGGGSSPEPNNLANWKSMITEMQDAALSTRLRIPLLYGTDAVHGHNNLKDAVIFPHNINLGAANDKELVENIGEITALEMRISGTNYNFAPCIAVSRDERWGRTYESYSENKEIVSSLGDAFVRGQQKGWPQKGVATSIKHFVGDGSTDKGKDRSNSTISKEELYDIHLYPYLKAIESGATSVMISQHSWNGEEMHGYKELITDVLKGELGFKGFVISDWAGIDQIPGNYYSDVVNGINAGIDLIMVPDKFKTFYDTAIMAVNNKDIPMERIDDAVKRILTVKFDLGLFENPYPVEGLDDLVGSKEHKKVARDAVNKSTVILKNSGVLPITDKKIVVAGPNADNLGYQCGGWTMKWQGASGNITAGTTILEGLKEVAPEGTEILYTGSSKNFKDADHIILVLGEKPYAEWEGDKTNIEIDSRQKRLIYQAKESGKKVTVILVSGRPMVITDELESIDALVAAFLPGTEGAGVADIVFGNVKPTGTLPFSWPKSNDLIPVNFDTNPEDALFSYGHGLTY